MNEQEKQKILGKLDGSLHNYYGIHRSLYQAIGTPKEKLVLEKLKRQEEVIKKIIQKAVNEPELKGDFLKKRRQLWAQFVNDSVAHRFFILGRFLDEVFPGEM
ncbi:MAG: hypothetical protein HWN68_18945 [Desulfobacterales bacterium]|nr:hypothetical protein [Desulfobacterales bacterium]